MKRTYIILVIACLLGIARGYTQDTFEQKKHKKGNISKTVGVRGLNTSKISAKRKPSSKTKTAINFQIPSAFSIDSSQSKYQHHIVKRSHRGIPLFIRSKQDASASNQSTKRSVEEVSAAYLDEISSLLRVKSPSAEFVTTHQKNDVMGQTHIKKQQMYKGVKVYGSEIVLHLNKKRQVGLFSGRSRPTPVLKDVVPVVSREEALRVVETDLGQKLPEFESNADNNLGIFRPEEELLIYEFQEEDYLVRHLTVFSDGVDRWEYFIDAHTGAIIDKYYHSCSLHHDHSKHSHAAIYGLKKFLPPSLGNGVDLNGVNRQLNTYNVNGTNYMVDTSKPMFNGAQSQLPDNPVGAILTLDLRNEPPVEGSDLFHVTSTTNTWNDPIAVSAHHNASVSYEYFRNTFNRNSINGEGGTIISIINVADPETGGGFDNAFWNGRAMFYGNGNVAFSSPLARALDVAGHEMSHGVIENTANLEYRNQPGAINESFADIFGAMIDRDDWKVGEDIVNRQIFTSGAMRDLQNPNNGGSRLGDAGWQPKDMTEFYTGSQDNGGVHINSGIPNRAYYLIASTIGKAKAEQIYYRALDTYLTVSSQFIDLRLAVVQSAIDIHGGNSQEVVTIRNAFDTVGIGDGAPTDTDNDIPVAEGDDFILSLDIRDSDPNTLYISDTEATAYFPLTTTRLFRKPSVADDGSFAIYVTENNTVNAITLDQNTPEETVISNEPVWAAVALSKDGTKLATVGNDESNVIFISDLVTGDFKAFELYNPTTSNDGTVTGEVLYPDALEWDYSGQYLVYDALNRFENAQGNSIEYWDVGALRVWDNQTNTFGDGEIQKIFSNLPDGISIGNPSFSKTSGNILAFDYFDAVNSIYEVITANIETGEVRTVYENNKLGFPNYSKNDDKIIFDTFNNGDEDIAVIDIAVDKISPLGTASALIPNGKWGVWYAVGSRNILSSEKEITDFRFNVVSPAAVGTINGNQITVDLPNTINRSNLIATFGHSAKSTVSIAGVEQQSGVSVNDFTTSVIYRVTAEDGSTKDFTVSIGTSQPVDPNDSDGDGVPNAQDLCPNTPFGAIVDVSGCEIFSLPANNFRVMAKGESCINSSNGAITVESTENLGYIATLVGNGVNLTNGFTNTVSFTDLKSGIYNVCITVQNQPSYESCFDITVSPPETLTVNSKVNVVARSVSLDLSGGDEYIITIDDEVIVTKESKLNLSLKSNTSKLIVKTDKECQGVYEEQIDLLSKISIYPNPVSEGEIIVTLGVKSEGQVPFTVSTLDGKMILQDSIEPNTNTVRIDSDLLTSGIYILSIRINGVTRTLKIVKQ